VGILLLLSVLLDQSALIDVALLLALLAAVAAAAFTGQQKTQHD
jgi:multicomponent Na+:H+ antiporter subunit F